MTLTVVCVLKSGGIYGPEWVEKLQHAVMANLSRRHRFTAETDGEAVEVYTLAAPEMTVERQP